MISAEHLHDLWVRLVRSKDDPAEVNKIFHGDDKQQQNLQLNRIAIEHSRRPEEYDIPRAYFYTEFDPRYWDLKDDATAEYKESLIEDIDEG